MVNSVATTARSIPSPSGSNDPLFTYLKCPSMLLDQEECFLPAFSLVFVDIQIHTNCLFCVSDAISHEFLVLHFSYWLSAPVRWFDLVFIVFLTSVEVLDVPRGNFPAPTSSYKRSSEFPPPPSRSALAQ